VTLIKAPDALPTSPHHHSRKVTVKSQLVVVIDDDDAVRDSVSVLLEAVGLEVRSFASAIEFLNSDAIATAGCLLLDYHMPGMTGIELIYELRRRSLTYPTILITGLSDSAIQRRAFAAGVLEVLRKGAPDTVIVETIQRALRTARATDIPV
jgi:FixJ family two-component response regulator